MNYEQLLSQLNTESSEIARPEIIDFLKHSHHALKDRPDQTSEIAYSIAGLMATDFAKSLPHDDPINTILTIAGELEIEPHNSAELYNELLSAIEQL